MTNIILDGIVILTFTLSILLCYKRGFLRSLLKLMGNLLAIVASFFLSKWLAPMIYDSFFKNSVTQKLQEILMQTPVDNATQLIEKLPTWIQNQNISDLLIQALNAQTTADATVSIADQILTPFFIFLISCTLFLVFFLLLKFLLLWVYKALGIIGHLPFLSCLNKLLGAFVGIPEAVVILLIFASIFYLIIILTGNHLSWLNDSLINDTNLFFVFYRFNLLHLFGL